MDAQNIIAFAIVLAAIVYAGSIALRKTRSFSKKSGCASDCGCEGRTSKSNAARS
ncbi:MAG: FeoB-associated Cys-rich membrane protein [Pyrinomonadaceae bacterium]